MFIDRCYSIEQMAEAHRYVDMGHKKESWHHGAMMPNEQNLGRDPDLPKIFKIWIKGHLGQ